MRLHKGSQTVKLLEVLWFYEQLPFSALEMMSADYEWNKDCMQRLIKEGYVGVIKDTNLKSLYLKPAGQKAWLEYCERVGRPVNPPRKPSIVYNADKARRVERINEARMLVDAAGFHSSYLTAPEAKSLLEQDAARQSDNIKYSRFAGILFTEKGGLMVYHFGSGNLHLNSSGELNAKFAADKLYRQRGGKEALPRFSMLVLGTSVTTAMDLLKYSDLIAQKDKAKGGHVLKRHFNFKDFKKMFDDILFLPIISEAWEMLPVLAAPGNGLYETARHHRQEGRHMVNLLECRMPLWNHFREQIPEDKPVDFLCYRWQVPLIVEYFIEQKEMVDPRCCFVSMEHAGQIAGLTP